MEINTIIPNSARRTTVQNEPPPMLATKIVGGSASGANVPNAWASTFQSESLAIDGITTFNGVVVEAVAAAGIPNFKANGVIAAAVFIASVGRSQFYVYV